MEKKDFGMVIHTHMTGEKLKKTIPRKIIHPTNYPRGKKLKEKIKQDEIMMKKIKMEYVGFEI